MTVIAQRLTLPFVVSAMGVLATNIWYVRTQKKYVTSGPQKTVAILVSKQEDVQRRPAERLIWQDVQTGDPLYGGEAVRTSATAQGKIKFLESGIAIDLEPDSLVVLEEKSGTVELNLVNGGLFVKTEQAEGKGSSKSPVIKAGQRKISLEDRSAQMNLSLDKGGQASLTVQKGQVKVSNAAGKSETFSEGKSAALRTDSDAQIQTIDVLSPVANAHILVPAANDAKITFRFKPIAQTHVTLELGVARTNVQSTGVIVPGQSGTLTAKVPIGGFFWRLVAKDAAGKQTVSPLLFNDVMTLQPPILMNANPSVAIVKPLDKDVTEVPLEWSVAPGVEDVKLQVSTDEGFRNIQLDKAMGTTNRHVAALAQQGTFFWRVLAKWQGYEQWVPSAVGRFTIEDSAKIPVPTLVPLVNGPIFSSEQLERSPLTFGWDAPEGHYQANIVISKDNKIVINETIAEQSIYKTGKLPAGQYRWTVRLKMGERFGEFSAWRNFTIHDVKPFIARIGNDKNILILDNPDKTYSLSFAQIPNDTKVIRYRINDGDWSESKSTTTKIKITKPATYELEGEAFNGSKQKIGVLQKTTFSAQDPPELPAPQWKQPKQVQATAAGEADVRWNVIDGATRYTVVIVDTKNKKTIEREQDNALLKLRNLLPGDYIVKVRAVDGTKRPGKWSDELLVKVPTVSNVEAPKVKKIQIR